jgi:FAD:protein FMN transferase
VTPHPAVHTCFRAMSTEAGITVVGGHAGLTDWAHRRVDRLEQLWSRFRDDSDIARLNRACGEPVEVSRETVAAVTAACAAWSFTGGCFDPTVHDSLLRLGYDDTIEAVRQRGGITAARGPLPPPGCTGIVFDATTSIVQLPAGVRLDLGGIGKGLAADDVATGLMERGAMGAMVNIGGDVRVIGAPTSSAAWRVEVEDPRTERTCAVVELLDGGVATSTTLRRRWRLGAATAHHLIDPRSGANPPSGSAASVVGVTVVAGTAGWADALSKVPFIDLRYRGESRPAEGGPFEVASALVIREDGTTGHYGPSQFSMVAPA